MQRASSAPGRSRRAPLRRLRAWLTTALLATVAAVTLSGAGAPAPMGGPPVGGPPAPGPARVLVAVGRPAAPTPGERARDEVRAVAEAALADATATVDAFGGLAPDDLVTELADAVVRLRAFLTPGGRGPVSPPPGQMVLLADVRAATADVFRAAAAVRTSSEEPGVTGSAASGSTVSVRWAAPETLVALEAQVAELTAAAAALPTLARPGRLGASRAHPAVTEADLCPVPFAPQHRLRCDAARALGALDAAYRSATGAGLTVTSSFRTHDEQAALRLVKGSLAAVPGTSNHERGVAVDLGGVGGLGDFSSARYAWLAEHGPRFGWVHPPALGPGGSGPDEPWHWEFVGPVASSPDDG